MNQQFKGAISLSVAAREIVLHGIELTSDRVLLAYNATVGHIYHNFSDSPAQVSVSGGNTILRFAPFKDCDPHNDTDEVAVFYDDGVYLDELIKTESDETQALIKSEFDEMQTGISNFETLVAAEFEETKTLVGAEHEETRTLVGAEFDEARSGLSDFQTLVSAEFDETRSLMSDRLLAPIAGKLHAASFEAFSAEAGYSQVIQNRPFFGPSQISQSRAGGGSLNVSIQYDNYGNVLSVSPI